MRLALLTPALLIAAQPAAAQEAPQEPMIEDVRINQLIVYGSDPCPRSGEDEIIVCARRPEADRYRIPENLRRNFNDPANRTWTDRAIELSYVGRSGIGSCSPTGPGGFVGCQNELIRQAREERAAMEGVDWTTLIAEARENRMRRIEREIEADERNARPDD